jgi:hypothetical protein
LLFLLRAERFVVLRFVVFRLTETRLDELLCLLAIATFWQQKKAEADCIDMYSTS